MVVRSDHQPLTAPNAFVHRHLGVRDADRAAMLASLGLQDLDELIDAAVPPAIREQVPLALPAAATEAEVLAQLRAHADRNDVRRAYIGLGYHGTITPAVIRRNVLEDPGWYTAYTPYQPEISQGRLEALLTFQTMVADLTGLELAGSSLLDEATAAAEGVQMCRRASRKRVAEGTEVVLIDQRCHPQTIAVVTTRLQALGVEPIVADLRSGAPAGSPPDATFTAAIQDGHQQPVATDRVVAVLLQSPDTDGVLHDDADLIADLHAHDVMVTVATDLLACTVIAPPGAQGADVAVGSSQRFGVPMMAGGPHAAFIATSLKHARQLPGRLVGVSADAKGRTAYRLALQTREQHIRRERATSNICTSQVLLAVVAAMYAVHHGPDGLTAMARRVHGFATVLRELLTEAGFETVGETWFDTITVRTGGRARQLREAAADAGYELGTHPGDDGTLTPGDGEHLRIALDETTTAADVAALAHVLTGRNFDANAIAQRAERAAADGGGLAVPRSEDDDFLTDPRFSMYRSETELMRWLRKLKDKDIGLDRSMIPLGSCTMKLNAAVEMEAVTWPQFADLHPFAPLERSTGTRQIIADLEEYLAEVTGYDAVSLQPNAGAQGEFAGLLAIRGYHRDRGESQRRFCLVPASAHGTNAASAVMAGMQVKVVACDAEGNIDVDDLRRLVALHAETLAAIMLTYPSTHGVYETTVSEICALVHDHGGQVYLDGANLNALVGIARPGRFGADVSHLNLHKTFCIPHGGGGPGVGPVACRSHLAPYLPAHPATPASWHDQTQQLAPESRTGPVAAAPWGSAGILSISWAYIRLMGADGLTQATRHAILAANYVAHELKDTFEVLYTGDGWVAHEAILDVRPLQQATSTSNEDVAKRLIDYGFHAPTMSFPVPGTLMVEPTESESLRELDRFIAAMRGIKAEADRIAAGQWPAEDNPLVHAPHPAQDLVAEMWPHPYSREVAAYPNAASREDKYWPPVSRVDNARGDRNLQCSCPPPHEFEQS